MTFYSRLFLISFSDRLNQLLFTWYHRQLYVKTKAQIVYLLQIKRTHLEDYIGDNDSAIFSYDSLSCSPNIYTCDTHDSNLRYTLSSCSKHVIPCISFCTRRDVYMIILTQMHVQYNTDNISLLLDR